MAIIVRATISMIERIKNIRFSILSDSSDSIVWMSAIAKIAPDTAAGTISIRFRNILNALMDKANTNADKMQAAEESTSSRAMYIAPIMLSANN